MSLPAQPESTYHRLVRMKRLMPRWLLYRLDPYNTCADAFVEQAAHRLPAGAWVLDAGAGECRHAPYFAHVRYLGTDSGVGEKELWDYTRLAFFSELTAIPLASHSVDAIVSVNVLEHVEEPLEVLRECCRTLRPNGRLFMVAPQSWRVHQAPADFLRFTRFGLEHLLKKAGFKVEELHPIGGTFWNFGTRSVYLLTHFRGRRFPLALLLAPLLGFLIPFVCFYLDRLDRNREDTLGYTVVARPAGPEVA